MKSWSKYLIAALLLFSPSLMWGQFYMAGDDPGRLRWRTTETDHYKLIYPKGLDSLARIYGAQLEHYRNPVGQSIKYLPLEFTKRKLPVVFHAYNSYSNASVAWAPKRMDVYTQPEAYEPDPMPWETMLAIHEQRHVAQMQFGLSHKLRPFNWFLGEMFNGATCGIYCYTGYLEGDAVIAETALTNSGRGRTSDFLNYYMISFDQDDWRNLPKWAKGSYRRYTPNQYSLGYMYFGGVRYFWDEPEIVGKTFRNAAQRPLKALFSRSHTIKGITGSNFWRTFDTVAVKTYEIWKEEADARGPYMPVDTLVKTPYFYTQYKGLAATENGIVGYRSSLNKVNELVRLDYDNEDDDDDYDKPKKVRQFSSYSSNIKASEDGAHIYWSETVSGERWDLSNRSVIRRADASGRHARTLTRNHKYYNPTPSPDESLICVSEYPEYGHTFVTILNEDGDVVERYQMPDGFQVVENAWIGNDIYFTGVTAEGFGVYKLVDGEPFCIMEALPVMIKDFHSVDGLLAFTSDRTGVEEFYELAADGSRLTQVTCTRYGGHDYQYSADREWLYFSAAQHDGELLSRTATSDLPRKEVDVRDIHKYVIADKLSEQEAAFSYEKTSEDEVEFSDERKYHKFPHAFHVHSWAPLCIDGSTIMDQDVEDVVSAARLGATAIMQNNLGTLTGVVSYGINPDTDGALKDNGKKKWRNSLHGTIKYTGWYPVFEASIDFNDRGARLVRPLEFTNTGKGAYIGNFRSLKTDVPYVRGNIKAYIPWSWSKGGWHSGVTPQVSYSICNDTYTSGYLVFQQLNPEEVFVNRVYVGYKKGHRMPFQAASASVRAYTMQSTAASAVYPRFGIGGEVGMSHYLGMKLDLKYKSGSEKGMNMFSPSMYAFVYAYLPGVVPQQGIRVSAKLHHGFMDDGLFHSGSVNPLPRGLNSNSALLTAASISAKNALGFTFDYAIPFWIGDPCLCNGLFHASNMILTPHFDWFMNGDGYLYSAGASLEIGLRSLFWIGVPINIGVTYSYNGGSAWNAYTKNGVPMDRHYVGPVFSVDF